MKLLSQWHRSRRQLASPRFSQWAQLCFPVDFSSASRRSILMLSRMQSAFECAGLTALSAANPSLRREAEFSPAIMPTPESSREREHCLGYSRALRPDGLPTAGYLRAARPSGSKELRSKSHHALFTFRTRNLRFLKLTPVFV